VERAQVFLELDLNKYSVSVDLLVNGKNFCGNGSHLWRFLRLTSPEMETALRELQARTGTRGGERVEDTRACRRRSLALFKSGDSVIFYVPGAALSGHAPIFSDHRKTVRLARHRRLIRLGIADKDHRL
jgi:hypothetical protein